MNCGHVFRISIKRQKITLAFFFLEKTFFFFFFLQCVCVQFFVKARSVISVYSCYFPSEENDRACKDLISMKNVKKQVIIIECQER